MIDINEQLIDAYLNGEKGFQFYVNRNTSEIFIPSEEDFNEFGSVLYAIPYKTSKELYEWMVEFSKLQESKIEELLFLALNNRKPILHFNEVISTFHIQLRWSEFERVQARKMLLNWIQSI